MNRLLRKVLITAAAAVLTAAFGLVSYAYDSDDKAIRSVGITVDGFIEVDTKFGEEELEVHTSGNKYDFDYYEVQNDGFRWSPEDTPDIKIYLEAAEGYYFHTQTSHTPIGV